MVWKRSRGEGSLRPHQNGTCTCVRRMHRYRWRARQRHSRPRHRKRRSTASTHLSQPMRGLLQRCGDAEPSMYAALEVACFARNDTPQWQCSLRSRCCRGDHRCSAHAEAARAYTETARLSLREPWTQPPRSTSWVSPRTPSVRKEVEVPPSGPVGAHQA